MGQTTHIGDILVPPQEKIKEKEKQFYQDVTFAPKTIIKSAQLAKQKQVKDIELHRDRIAEMNKQKEKIITSERFSTRFREQYEKT